MYFINITLMQKIILKILYTYYNINLYFDQVLCIYNRNNNKNI